MTNGFYFRLDETWGSGQEQPCWPSQPRQDAPAAFNERVGKQRLRGDGILAAALFGGLLLGVVPDYVLLPAAILLISAVKSWRHQ